MERQQKLNSNISNCRYAGVECIPVVAETLGGLAPDFISTIALLGSRWDCDPAWETRLNTSLCEHCS